MNSIFLNKAKYEDLAHRYEFDKERWDTDKNQCIKSMINAIESFFQGSGYVFELNDKEVCININPYSHNGRVHGRTAGVYAVPTKGTVRIYLNKNTYIYLINKYELPECKEKNGQYTCYLNFCELCSFIEAIVSM